MLPVALALTFAANAATLPVRPVGVNSRGCSSRAHQCWARCASTESPNNCRQQIHSSKTVHTAALWDARRHLLRRHTIIRQHHSRGCSSRPHQCWARCASTESPNNCRGNMYEQPSQATQQQHVKVCQCVAVLQQHVSTLWRQWHTHGRYQQVPLHKSGQAVWVLHTHSVTLWNSQCSSGLGGGWFSLAGGPDTKRLHLYNVLPLDWPTFTQQSMCNHHSSSDTVV